MHVLLSMNPKNSIAFLLVSVAEDENELGISVKRPHPRLPEPLLHFLFGKFPITPSSPCFCGVTAAKVYFCLDFAFLPITFRNGLNNFNQSHQIKIFHAHTKTGSWKVKFHMR